MIHFDEVLRTAKTILTADPIAKHIDAVLVLRDLRGRIRLLLTPALGDGLATDSDCERLRARLAATLGPFWGGVVEVDSPSSDFAKLLAPFRQEAKPVEPASEFANWSIVERHAAKSGWTSGRHCPPWPLIARRPPVVAWYSHKGGVGRTTALCATAMHLAREGQKVVVVDLDLEAPGLGTLLAGAPVEYGVADYLLERVLAGQAFDSRIDDYVTRQTDPALIGESGEPIVCMPAGVVNEHYLEKLARLDYELLGGQEQPECGPLANLLQHIRDELKPAFIFLDCRAGLHDLGGLAVQQLSHASVIFGLDSQQSWDGLRCIIRRLGLIGKEKAPPCLLIQAMEEGAPGARRDEARERFLNKSYSVFCDEFYEENAVPDIAAAGEAHDPFPLAYDPRLAGYQTLAQAAELLLEVPYPMLTERVKRLVGRATTDVRP
jgi:cellulose biosynthesis protein BcsQ